MFVGARLGEDYGVLIFDTLLTEMLFAGDDDPSINEIETEKYMTS